jgi:hypothetical protein
MTEHIRDDRTPDKDEQRQALPGRIWAALGAERNRGERHVDEIGTDHLVDAVMLPVDEYADGLHDDLSDDNDRLRADLAKADAACIEARAELATANETLTKFVAASLETDYTVDADVSDGYDTDADEQAAALANIAEMHRVLLVREGRLFAAYEEVDKLRAAQRPVPVEAGDSTADETQKPRWAPGDKVEFVDAEAKTQAGEVMRPEHGEYSSSYAWVDTGRGRLGIFIVPNQELRPASSVRDTAETADAPTKPAADLDRAPDAPSAVAPSCCGTTSDCTETQCFCEPDTCGHVGETPGGADEPRAMRAWQQGDPMPADVNYVRDTGDRRWCLNRTDCVWYLRDIAGPTYSWVELMAIAGPLTEVRTTDGAA